MFRALLAASVLLCLTSVVVNIAFGVAGADADHFSRHFFDVDSEQNLPTWFSVVELALAGLLAFAIGREPRSEHAAAHRLRWRLLAVILALMSLDELASLHEASSAYVRDILRSGDAIPYAWVIPGLVLVAFVVVAYARFFLALPRRVRQVFMLAASVYVGSAAGLELVDGWVNGEHARPLAAAKIALTTIQEGGEMLGVALAIYGLLVMADSRS